MGIVIDKLFGEYGSAAGVAVLFLLQPSLDGKLIGGGIYIGIAAVPAVVPCGRQLSELIIGHPEAVLPYRC
jgi:F0F1-type ATP synthase alpha subunit